MTVNTFSLLCHCHYHPSPELSSSCKTDTLCSLGISAPPQPQLLAASTLLSVSDCARSLMYLWSSHSLCLFLTGFFHLAQCFSDSFTLQHVSVSFLFKAGYSIVCMYKFHVVFPSICRQTLSCSQLLAIVNICCVSAFNSFQFRKWNCWIMW